MDLRGTSGNIQTQGHNCKIYPKCFSYHIKKKHQPTKKSTNCDVYMYLEIFGPEFSFSHKIINIYLKCQYNMLPNGHV